MNNWGYKPGARDVFTKKNKWWKLPLAIGTMGVSLGQRDLEMLAGLPPGTAAKRAAANRATRGAGSLFNEDLDRMPDDKFNEMLAGLGQRRGKKLGQYDPEKKEWTPLYDPEQYGQAKSR
jgi:hypothetical protein